MSVFATGDTHGGQEGDMRKLSTKKWKAGAKLTRSDYLIVAGDFGLVWFTPGTRRYEKDLHYRNWLDRKPWTTLFIDGNHENHDLLAQLEQVPMFGSTVGKLTDNIFHLKRGEVYTINDKKYFTFGGAQSTDKDGRMIGINWWPQEIPNNAEMEHGLNNLEKHNNEVDYIISHTCPRSVANEYMTKFKFVDKEYGKLTDPTTAYLDRVVEITKFKSLYFGHWHDDWKFEKYNMLYRNIVGVE